MHNVILPHLLATRLRCVKDSLVLTTVKQKWIFSAAVLLIKLDMMKAEELPGLRKLLTPLPPLFAPSPSPPLLFPIPPSLVLSLIPSSVSCDVAYKAEG